MRDWTEVKKAALDQRFDFTKGQKVSNEFQKGDVVRVSFDAVVRERSVIAGEYIVAHPHNTALNIRFKPESLTLVRSANDPASDPVGTHRVEEVPGDNRYFVKVANNTWQKYGGDGRAYSDFCMTDPVRVCTHEEAIDYLRGGNA